MFCNKFVYKLHTHTQLKGRVGNVVSTCAKFLKESKREHLEQVAILQSRKNAAQQKFC